MEGEAVGAVAARVLCGGRAEGRAGSNGVPVSYTHLDVYKRQDNCSGLPGFRRPERLHQRTGAGKNTRPYLSLIHI